MKKCLITGISGSGGSYLAEWILKNHPEYEVWGISRWGSTKTNKNIIHIQDKLIMKECDLNDLSSIIRVLKECIPDKIFNLAATANVAISFITPLSVLQNNIFGTANLLEGVRIICPETIFQMCSTSEVYGTPLTMPIKEEHPLNPPNPYAVSKLAGEKLTYSYYKSYGIKAVISRAFCYLNPKRYDLFATSFARQIVNIENGNQDILYHGNLESIRTIMSIWEMCEAYWIASEKCEYGVAYNIGGHEPITVNEVLNKLISKAKCSIKTKLKQSLLRPVDVTSQCPDVSKFFNKTGWKQKMSIDEGIGWLLNECRKDINK